MLLVGRVLDAVSRERYLCFMASLQPNDRKALQAVVNGGLLRGRDIQRRTGLTADQVKASLQVLKNENFITLHNGSNNLLDNIDAYVAVLPSRRVEAEYEASQMPKV